MQNINTIKLATFNLCNFAAPPFAFYEMDNIYTSQQWSQKTRWLEKTLRLLDADIIAFQEVFSAETLRMHLDKLGYRYFYLNQDCHIEADYIYSEPSLAFASRFPLTQQANLPFLSGTEGEFSRPPLHVTLDIGDGHNIDFYNVHLKSQRPASDILDSTLESTVEQWLNELHASHASTQLRQTEVLSLHNAIVTRKKSTYNPAVLLGDFNNNLDAFEFTPLRSNHLRRQPLSTKPIFPYTLLDSWALFQQRQASPSAVSPITHYYGAKGNRLDHILLSPEFDISDTHSLFELQDYQLVDKHIIDPRFGDDDVSTDHAIVSITLKRRDQSE
ncbi:endonuclease/exonuclease/phosphatase family protein [Vibrio methylphosphonaticus]|uniref:endonuclease/exonuclease/phosphatase family protein n=1 Tax=Vibrio methylphosphonaticus TaxID=2946866 RepID=UPI002029C3ED|nr:endonuclease/exonuclease/phosphatase family protein [Vibrio methylphosphonaticus]MCL9775756.1 endonuclease/exonuclease/phosphatase family protein [Vibrio methylphosphonaticus]